MQHVAAARRELQSLKGKLRSVFSMIGSIHDPAAATVSFTASRF